MHRVLVTGASSWVGGRLIQSLETRDDTEVFAIDEIAPSLEFASDFATLDGLELADHVISVQPSTVVHLPTIALGTDRARDVLGAQALFAALERVPDLRTVIVMSDAAVYGCGPRNPSVVRESTRTPARLTRYERSLQEVESSITRLADELANVTFTLLRFNPILGPTIGNAISRYLQLPVVPTLLGSDPRLQFVHEDDAAHVLEHAIDFPRGGTFNIAGDGQLYLSRVLRLGKRINYRLPTRQFNYAMQLLRPLGASLPPHLVNLVRYGRVTDTALMSGSLGFEPKFNCRRSVLATFDRLPAAR